MVLRFVRGYLHKNRLLEGLEQPIGSRRAQVGSSIRRKLLVVAPFVHPSGLNELQVAFIGFFALAFKVGDFENPLQQVGEANAVDFILPEVITEAFVELHCNVFVVDPVDRHVVNIFKCHDGCVFGMMDGFGLSLCLVFVTDDLALVGDVHLYDGIVVEDFTLTS